MKKLILTTTRFLTEEEYEEYKKVTPLDINWEFLEENGVCTVYTHKESERVQTHAQLKQV